MRYESYFQEFPGSLAGGSVALVPGPASTADPRKFRFPIRCTMLLPTASTAPPGFIKLGPFAASFSTLNRRMLVPFQTPTAPRAPTCISAPQTKDHSSDSYQPRESGDHSKLWMRGGDGSMPWGRDGGGVVDGLAAIIVMIVCSGSEGSHESIWEF